MSDHPDRWPARLDRENTDTAGALRAYQESSPPEGNEAAAYARVVARLARGRSFSRRWLIVGAGALALSALAVLMRSRAPAAHVPGTVARSSSTVPTIATPLRAVAKDATVVVLGPTSTQLPVGHLDLGDGVIASLANDSAASARREQGTLDLTLTRGTAEFQVSARPRGHAVLINADEHRFTVVGTTFGVAHLPGRLELTVAEGLVTVSRQGEHLATVASGESWSSSAPPVARDRVRSEPRRARRPPSPGDCARFTGEQTAEKVACYRALVQRGGPDGERAQHALGRYLRDDVVDLTAALAAFEAQRVRYPRGELRSDADHAIIELLPRLGRHSEALVETQSLLDASTELGERAELRLLRGDIYRAIFQDVTSAEREYEEGADAEGRTGDDSRFLRALCLEALGRVEEARIAYGDYLAQPGTAHALEAQRRMQRLGRP